jgi:Transglutaminase-like superfamily
MTREMGRRPVAGRLTPMRRLRAMAAVGAAGLLATQSPTRIMSLLGRVSSGAAPASRAHVLAAIDAVNAVGLPCRRSRGSLVRSIAAALLCRMSGVWPSWVVGVRMVGPFAAHAWVEAEGAPVGESHPDGYYLTLLIVPPRST